ncbi:hypothetical protein [Spirosoma koreense]
MLKPVDPQELFIGAVVQQMDIDTFTAVITGLHETTVDVVDIYGWNECPVRPLKSITPKPLDYYLLRRFGFAEALLQKNCFQYATPYEIITLLRHDTGWELLDGTTPISITYAHQLQHEVKQLFGAELVITPRKDGPDDDYY